MKSVVPLAFVLAIVLAALPIGLHASATPHMIFASVGIAHGQTARLNISNINNPDLLDSGLPAGPCNVAFGFVDGSNQMLVPAVRVALGGSRSTHVDVSLDSQDLRRLPGFQGNRGSAQVRAVVGFPSAAEGSCGSVVASVEIVDNQTGATTVMQSPLVYVGFNPQPDLPGIVGLPSGQ
jgi:hypothetical protein